MWIFISLIKASLDSAFRVDSVHKTYRSYSPGGALTCQRYSGMCRFDDPPFQAPPPFQGPTFLHLVSVLMPSVVCFSKNSAFLGPFLSDFGKISAPNTLIWAKICTQGHFFFKEKNLFCRSYFWKPMWHIPTKKKKKMRKNRVPSSQVTASSWKP